MRSFVAGVAVLILLDVVLAPDQNGNYTAAGRVGGLIGAAGAVVTHLLSPGVPLLPDLRSSPAATSSSGTVSNAVIPLRRAAQGPPGYPTAVQI